MAVREQVLQTALALSAEDRAFVAEQLERSLDHGRFASPEIAAAWTAEIDRRISAYKRGELQASDAEASIERMRGFLVDHRARRVNSQAALDDIERTLPPAEPGADGRVIR